MKYFLVVCIFLCALSCSTTQTHYKNYHGKTHYRSAGTRSYNSESGTFLHKLIPKHNNTNVQSTAASKNKATRPNNTPTGSNTKTTDSKKTDAAGSPPVTKILPLPTEATATASLLSDASYAKLKALIIVADIDGPTGQSTLEFIERGKRIEEYFKQKKIQVRAFYCPSDKWTDIVAASNGVNFLVYMGHGTTAGANGKWGGFCLTDGIVSSLTINQGLKLAPNSVVVFNSVCGGAGSSAGDTAEDIGIPEAEDRVTAYAHPFVDLNAAIYYANNYYYSAEQFLTDLLTSTDLEAIYKKEVQSYSNKTELIAAYPYNNKYVVGISSYPTNRETTYYSWSGNGPKTAHKVYIKNSYEIAMVYRKDFKIQDIVK